jgi:hypothetical protein
LWTRVPEWIVKLESIDAGLHDLLVEVYSAANDTQTRLFSMGLRAALDHTMTRIVGDVGGFEQKLDKMVEQRHLSEKQRETLATVIDAGSATAHRGFKPSQDLLEQMLAVMEGIVRDHYITGPMLATMRTTIPPRPTRK